MDLLRKYFDNFLKLNDKEWADFQVCLSKEFIPKSTQLLERGQVCDFIAFIHEGLFSFYKFENGEEKITTFFFAGDFVSNYRSFLTQLPSDHYIEALKDATIYKINLTQLNKLYDEQKTFERLGRLIAENLFLSVAGRLDTFMFDTPKTRYENLLKRNSKVLLEVPQYMIASYLGVKPETLSRIRSRK